MSNEELREILAEQFSEDELNEMVLLESPSYASAVIGVSDDNRLVYSYEKMVEHLVEEHNMSDEDAAEFIEYNTIRALPYQKNAPIIVHEIVGLNY